MYTTFPDTWQHGTRATAARVVICSADLTLVGAIAARLSSEDFELTTAGSLAECARLASTSQRPDVVLLDRALPGFVFLDEAVIWLRRQMPGVRIILATSEDSGRGGSPMVGAGTVVGIDGTTAALRAAVTATRARAS